MTRSSPKLYVALPQEGDFGWGIVSRGFMQEFDKLVPTTPVRVRDGEVRLVDAPAFVCLGSGDLTPVAEVRGTRSYGHAVFETALHEKGVLRAQEYEKILCSSSWCRDRCLEAGIAHADVLLQGIDPVLFHPAPSRRQGRGFVVFSGGKLEYRKGQDVVIKAMQILQHRYDDILLVTAWVNLWPHSMELLRKSPHITFEVDGDTWEERMRRLYAVNDLDPTRIVTMSLVPNSLMRDVYAQTDIGVFPNRCEGGTNLVMMEYMATGRPVIGSYATGHRDVLSSENALLLTDLKQERLLLNGKPFADWVSPSVDEVVAAVEYAYHHRDEIQKLGKRAACDMLRFTWEQSARNALRLMDIE